MNKSKIIEFESIGTRRYISIFDNISEESYKSITKKVIDFLDDFEEKYSRFRRDSLISQIGKYGYIYNPPKELLLMLDLAAKSEKLSNGYFNILIANTLMYLGYGKKGNNINMILDKILKLKDVLKRNTEKVEISKGRNIDLGGLGKGRAIDKIKNIIKCCNVKNFLINGGGDIYINYNLTDDPMIYFQDPQNMTFAIGHTTINYGGFASSSSFHRNWIKDGCKYHHLINPKTQNSSKSQLLAVHTYHLTSAVIADIASTIIYICDPDKIDEIAKNFEVEYLLILLNYQTVKSENFPAILYN